MDDSMDSPLGQLFTRQQIASLIGVSNDLLGYWMREDLLVPSSGGEGRGNHRRFDFVQVNVAAIYGQLRRFGLNIAALRSLADLLQSAARLGASCELHPSNYSSAAYLATALHRFRTAGEVLVSAHALGEKAPAGLRGGAYSDWLMAKKPAESESEIVEHLIGHRSDYDSIDAIVAAAETIGPNKETEARVYADLVYGVRAPEYADSYSWLLALQPGEPCRIEFGFDGAKFFDTVTAGSPEAFGPGIFLPVSGIIREIWGLKKYSEYRRERERDYIAEKLEAAGIKASVVVHDDEEQGFSIDHPGTEWSAVAAALKGTRYELTPKDLQA